jgi:hypothetical protein
LSQKKEKEEESWIDELEALIAKEVDACYIPSGNAEGQCFMNKIIDYIRKVINKKQCPKDFSCIRTEELEKLIENLKNLKKEIEIWTNNFDVPMGVSQWINHGEKYGYDKFFKKKLLDKKIKEIDNLSHDYFEPGDKDYCQGIELCKYIFKKF